MAEVKTNFGEAKVQTECNTKEKLLFCRAKVKTNFGKTKVQSKNLFFHPSGPRHSLIVNCKITTQKVQIQIFLVPNLAPRFFQIAPNNP